MSDRPPPPKTRTRTIFGFTWGRGQQPAPGHRATTSVATPFTVSAVSWVRRQAEDQSRRRSLLLQGSSPRSPRSDESEKRPRARKRRVRSRSIARCEGAWRSGDGAAAASGERTFPVRCEVAGASSPAPPFPSSAVVVARCSESTTADELLRFVCDAAPAAAAVSSRRVALEPPVGGASLAPDSLVSECPWVIACTALGALPTLCVSPLLSGARTRRRNVVQPLMLRSPGLFARRAAPAPPAPGDPSRPQFGDAFSLQVRIASGGQVLSTPCRWPTTFAEVRDSLVPQLLAARDGPRDKALFGVVPPAPVAELLARPSSASAPFAELCRACCCLPHVVVVEQKPAGGRVVFCQYHGAECYVVEGPDGPRHMSAASTYGHIDAEVDLLLTEGRLEHDEAEMKDFLAAAKHVRFTASKGRGSSLPTMLCSRPRPISPGEPFYAFVSLPLRQVVKTIPIPPTGVTADAFFEGVFQRFYSKITSLPSQAFVLKVKGLNSFICGTVPIAHFSYIQAALAKKKRADLIIVERPQEAPNPAAEEHFSHFELLRVGCEGYRYDHEKISLENVPWQRRTCVSAWDLGHSLRVKILWADGTFPRPPDAQALCVTVTAGLYHGGDLLCPEVSTVPVSFSSVPRWSEWLEFELPVCCVPQAARVCLTLSSRAVRTTTSAARLENDTPLGWVSLLLYDFKRELKQGVFSLALWPNERANPIGTCESNLNSQGATQLHVELERYSLPVVLPSQGKFPGTVTAFSPPPGSEARVSVLASKDSLYKLSAQDKQLIWRQRELAKGQPKLLAKVLRAIDYRNPADVEEGHRLMSQVELEPVDALELLESKFADPAIRSFAVRCMSRMPAEDLLDCLLQLLQALRYETHHRSDLAMFLLQRALHNATVGQTYYWSLKSSLGTSDSKARDSLMLEAFLRGCGSDRNVLLQQEAFIHKMSLIAKEVKALRDSERQEYLQRSLKATALPPRLLVPVHPDFLAGGIVVERCTYKDSSKMPLYIVLRNAEDGCEPLHVLFKQGDDLRQDGLTLQMIRIMDRLWMHEGLDLEMSPYRTMCCGDSIGLIEVVLNARTTAEIHKAAGGASAAFRQDPLANWLRHNNPVEAIYRQCVRRFAFSCAGYCTATYVLGIGDRHNDNIMLSTSGRLFHIDFGHFLGHKKKFAGINREPAPFVFTPDFAFVMGGRGAPDFEEFVSVACRAYAIVRRHASTFINLFALMLSTGIPELKSITDIEYLREAFALDMEEQEACSRFKDMIFLSLATWMSRLNNAVHIAMH